MLKLRKVAVTGNLHSGKSTVCQLLKKHGAFVLSADLIVHNLIQEPPVTKSIISIFGKDCLNSDGQLDRKKLSELAFRDESLLKKLELLLHPLVLEKILREFADKSSSSSKDSLFVVEVPLLFEAGWQDYFDLIILVKTTENLRRNRFLETRKDIENFYLRSSRQIDPKIAEKLSDEIIMNDQDFSHLESQVLAILKKLKTNQT